MNAKPFAIFMLKRRFCLIALAVVLNLVFSSNELFGGTSPSTYVTIYQGGVPYYWDNYYGGSDSPTNNPQLTACCDSADMYAGIGGCWCGGSIVKNVSVSMSPTNLCTISPAVTNEYGIGYHVSKPIASGTITITIIASDSCDETNSTTGTLEVNLTSPCGPSAGPAPCSRCSAGTGPKAFGSAAAQNGCIDFRLFLGPASMFDDGGYISLHAETPSASLTTPAALSIPFLRANITVFTNAQGVLQQVKTPLGLVNVISNTPYQFQLQVFSQNNVTGTGAPYGTNGPAFDTWVINNPDTNAAYNRLWITEQRPGQANRQFQYAYSDTSTQAQRWDLLEPDGQTVVSKWSVPNPTNSAITNLFWQTASGTNILSQTCSAVEVVPIVNGIPGNGTLTLSTVEGFGSTTQTTIYTYYPSNAPAGSANQLERVDYPSGNWEYNIYDASGRLTTNYTAFANSIPPSNVTNAPDPSVNLCKETDYTYDDSSEDPFKAHLTVALAPGTDGTMHEVSRYYYSVNYSGFIDQVQCSQPGAGESSDGSEWTRTYYDVSGRVNYLFYPDGTASYYTYYVTSTNFTTVETRGVMDDLWGDPSPYVSFSSGTQTTNVIDQLGRPQSKTVVDIQSGVVLSQVVYAYSPSDPLGQDYTVVDLAAKSTQYQYACCGLESILDPDGVATMYTYDPMKRVASTETLRGSVAVTTTNVYDGLNRVLATKRIGNDGSTIVLNQERYDVLGRVISETNALNGVTTHIYGMVNGQQCITNIYPNGETRIETYCRDGRLQSISGTAASPAQYCYGVEQDADNVWREYTLETKLDASGGTNEWTKSYTDMRGRIVRTVYSGATNNPSSAFVYDGTVPFMLVAAYDFAVPCGQLIKQADPDGVTTLYGYNDKGQMTVADMDRNGYIDYAGGDRITLTTNDMVFDHGCNVNRTQVFVWATNGIDTPTLVSTRETSTDGLESWNTIWNDGVGATSWSATAYGTNGFRYETNAAPDNSYTVNVYQYAQLTSSTKYDSAGTQIGQTTYGYDAHGRQNTLTDARNGTTTYGYNDADQVDSVTTPLPGGGQSAQTTYTYYNSSLRATNVVQPDGTSITSVYYPNGLLALTCGSRTYPVGYSYDAQGRMLTMTNWSDFSGGTGGRVTTWNYDPYRGFLTSKAYDGGAVGPSYEYTAAGRLQSRAWARGITTSYNYDNAGSLTNIYYADGITPGVTNTYDRLGRLESVVCDGMTDTLTYNQANELLSESFSGGTLDGLVITNGYDSLLRRSTLAALSGGSPLLSTAYGYDAASRLATVTDTINNNSATYNHFDNSPLVSQIAFTNGTTRRMITTKSYDYLNRLTQISSTPGGSGTVPVTFNYSYNTANQRTKNTLVDGSYWVYQYDSLGQVTGGVKYFADGTLVPGQQFGYLFDDIGNRKQTTAGGDASGGSLRVAIYTNNSLNQITSRDYPGTNDVIGVALATNSVTVNGVTAWRKGEYFQATVQTNNTSQAQWLGVTVASGGTTNTGNIYFPKTPEQFSYDADGNLTNDGRWSYVWDAENRLVQMTVNTNVGPQYQLNFVYDSQGRRIEKIVSTYNGSAYVAQSTNRFLYDGWNLIAELKPSNSLLRSYVWGTDLSGSMQGAGGVGGLLEASYYGASTTNCFPAFDGNGNVMALVNAADGTTVANYEYGPFGETIRMTGTMAQNNPFRFSTKYQDDESDLLYYGYRYYKPSTGTWPNRDPMDELGFHVLTTDEQIYVGVNSQKRIQKLNWYINWFIRGAGSLNRYEFSLNDPIDQFDSDGEDTWVPYPAPGHYVSDPPPPPPQYPPGFSLCQRDLQKDSACDCVTMAGNALGGEHTYLQYVDGSGNKWGFGWGGQKHGAPEQHFNPNSCKSCKKSSGSLKYGSGAGKSGNNATDAEIEDCIKNNPPTKPYSKFGYNCRSWAKEAAANCGLDCN